MRTTLACLILTLLTLGTACSQSGDPTDDHGLAAARTQWSAHVPSSYSFTWKQDCFCAPEMTRPIRINVTAGQITSAVFADDQRAVSDSIRRYLLTVEGLFDKIQDAIDRDADEITVAFDPTQGYPTSLFVDYVVQASDEELSIAISDFTSNAS